MCSCGAPALAWPPGDTKTCANAPTIGGALATKGCSVGSALPLEFVSTIKHSFLADFDNKIVTGFYNTHFWLARRSGVEPQVGFYDDGNKPNAFAVDASFIDDKCSLDGTILFGSGLFHSEIKEFTLWQSSVTLIHAHEYGHILQFKRKMASQITVQRELHADFLGGWFCGQMSIDPKSSGIDSMTAAKSIYNKGTYAFNDPNFHGTPEQRMQWVLSGYQHGIAGFNLDDAYGKSASALGI